MPQFNKIFHFFCVKNLILTFFRKVLFSYNYRIKQIFNNLPEEIQGEAQSES